MKELQAQNTVCTNKTPLSQKQNSQPKALSLTKFRNFKQIIQI